MAARRQFSSRVILSPPRSAAMSAGFFAACRRPGPAKDPVKFTIKSSPLKGRLESVFKRSQEIEEGEEVDEQPRPGTAATTTGRPLARSEFAEGARLNPPESTSPRARKCPPAGDKFNSKTAELDARPTTIGSGRSGEIALGTAIGVAVKKGPGERNTTADQGSAGSGNIDGVQNVAGAENDATSKSLAKTGDAAGRSACATAERTFRRPADPTAAILKPKPKRPREDVEEGEICSDDDDTEEPGQIVNSPLRRTPREIVDQYGRKKARHGVLENDRSRGVGNYNNNNQKGSADDPQALNSTARRPSMEGGNMNSTDKDGDHSGRDDDRSRIARASTERSPHPEDRTARFSHCGTSSSYCGRSPRSQASSPPHRDCSSGRQSLPRRPRSPRRPSPPRHRWSPSRAPRDRPQGRSRDEHYGRPHSPHRVDYPTRGPWRRDESDLRRDSRGREQSLDRRGRDQYSGGDVRPFRTESPSRKTAQKPAAFRDRGYNIPEFVPPSHPNPPTASQRRRAEQLAAKRRALDEQKQHERRALEALEEQKQSERRTREEEYEYAIKLSEETMQTRLLEALLKNSVPYPHQNAEIKRGIRKMLHSRYLPFEIPSQNRRHKIC